MFVASLDGIVFQRIEQLNERSQARIEFEAGFEKLAQIVRTLGANPPEDEKGFEVLLRRLLGMKADGIPGLLRRVQQNPKGSPVLLRERDPLFMFSVFAQRAPFLPVQ